MSNARLVAMVRIALIVLGVGVVPVAVMAFRPERHVPGSGFRVAALASPNDTVSIEVREKRSVAAVAHDAFRRNRAPSTHPYDGLAVELARQVPAAPVAPKPLLVLSGIVWGRRPAALIEGVPGQDGSRLMHPGDTAGGIRLRLMTRDKVLLSGFDTTWTLTIREVGK
ncbi:MAG: hypothetical protein ABI765_17970 [Gemmatimonadota bacterium]